MPKNNDSSHTARPLRGTTLADVARQAGVGESTVSRVLRGKGSYSEHTKSKVLEAADGLGYVPNRIAGTLASTGSQLVGIVIPSLATSVFPDLLRGANAVLEAAGFQSVIGVTEYSQAREERLIESLLSWRPTGLIVAGLEHTPRARALLKNSGIRVAELLDIDGEGIDIVVGLSNTRAGCVSAEHLLSRGYTRLGYVGNDMVADLRAAKRYKGFRAALAEHGVDIVGEQIMPGLSSIEGGRVGLAALMERIPDLDAVYFSNDDMAIGGYFHCLANAISVPGRLALFGNNGLDIARLAPHPLSTLRTPRVSVGEMGAKLLLSNGPSEVVDMGFELVIGATT